MLKTSSLRTCCNATMLCFGLIVTGCAGIETLPVAVSCPKPPPVPSVLTDKPASTGPSLRLRFKSTEQGFEDDWTKLEDSLKKAAR